MNLEREKERDEEEERGRGGSGGCVCVGGGSAFPAKIIPTLSKLRRLQMREGKQCSF